MKNNIFELYDSTDRVWNKFSDDEIILEKGESLPSLPPAPTTADEIEEEKKKKELQKNTSENLTQKLKTAIQMPNIMVLAGSGTSLGPIVDGPSMGDLWNACTIEDGKIFSATDCFSECGYETNIDGHDNIELCLSHCEAYIQINPNDFKTKKFVEKSKEIILNKCHFINNQETQLIGHKEFIRKLSRRKAKDPRIKLFTTNYDTCFESAAGKLGITVIDGFSFSFPRVYDPRFFDIDIVRRNQATSTNNPHYVEGVFQLFKLHGSTNWKRENDHMIVQTDDVQAENSCMIFPAKGKYQQSYLQPHLELISRFTQGLREPNTCLIIIGFGFNDDHLSEPILSAITSNPHLKVIIVTPTIKADIEKTSKNPSKYWEKFKYISDTRKTDELIFINSDFQKFANIIPDLNALSPAENLYETLNKAFGGNLG